VVKRKGIPEAGDLFLARRQASPYIQDSGKEIANAGKKC